MSYLDELRALAVGDHFDWPFRAMSVSPAEAELLYALVVAVEPRLILELGTGLGLTARFMAEAQTAVGFGELVTVEPIEEIREQAIENLSVVENVIVVDYPGPVPVDDPALELVYIDSGIDYRTEDLDLWLGGGYRGIVVFHDAERDYTLPPAARGVTIPTRNGIWIGRAE